MDSESERPVALVGVQRQRSPPYRLADLVFCGDLLLGLAENVLDSFARHDDDPVPVAHDPVAGCDADASDDDRDVAMREELPARDAVLRGHVTGEDGEALAQDEVDVSSSTVDDGARTPAGCERRGGELTQVRTSPVIRLID